MRQAHGEIEIASHGQGLQEITQAVRDWLDEHAITEGLLTVFCRHTSASLIINENAALAVRRDLERYFNAIAPESRTYEHDDEGPDDMPAHIKTALTNVSLSIPITRGQMVLGTWQGIYLFEHRTARHRRHLALHVIGE